MFQTEKIIETLNEIENLKKEIQLNEWEIKAIESGVIQDDNMIYNTLYKKQKNELYKTYSTIIEKYIIPFIYPKRGILFQKKTKTEKNKITLRKRFCSTYKKCIGLNSKRKHKRYLIQLPSFELYLTQDHDSKEDFFVDLIIPYKRQFVMLYRNLTEEKSSLYQHKSLDSEKLSLLFHCNKMLKQFEYELFKYCTKEYHALQNTINQLKQNAKQKVLNSKVRAEIQLERPEYCSYCYKEVEENDKFCPACGVEIKNVLYQRGHYKWD